MSSKPLTDAISDGRLLIVRLSMLGPFPTRLETWQVNPDMLHNVARLARVIPVVIGTSRPVAEAARAPRPRRSSHRGPERR